MSQADHIKSFSSKLSLKTTLLLILATSFTSSQIVTSGSDTSAVDTAICKRPSADNSKCLECFPNYFLSYHGACLACTLLVPNCKTCDQLNCTDCKFPYEVTSKTRSSDKQVIYWCQKPYWMENVFFLLGIALLPIILTVLVTVCFVDCYYDFQYSKQNVCCKKVRSLQVVSPGNIENNDHDAIESLDGENKGDNTIRADLKNNKRRRGGISQVRIL